MIYQTAAEWRAAPRKRVLLFGMSGLGKTHLANMLRDQAHWFHYSVDYRIGTRYMGEFIADNFKREAMKVPLLRELLMTDSRLHRLEHHLRQPRAAVDLSRQAGRSGARAACPSPNTAAVRTSTARPRSRPCSTPPRFIERADDIYGYTELRLRQRRLDLRGGRCRRSGRPGDDGAVAEPAAGLDQGVRGAPGRT